MKLANSGAWRLNSLKTVETAQTNIPAFQRKFPFFDKRVRQLRVRLFAETDDVMHRRAVTRCTPGFALFDVAETRARPGRLDPDRDQRARFLRRVGCGRECALERRRVLDHVIRRQHHHRREMIARRHPAGAERNRRRRVAFRRFGHDILRGKIRQQRADSRFLFDIR